MSAINRVDAYVWTSSASDAGTDGAVFLGLGGREFRLSAARKKGFKRDRGDLFVLQPNDPSVTNISPRDPTIPIALFSNTLSRFPSYLRHEGDDHWKLRSALCVIRREDGMRDFLAPRIDQNDGNSGGGLWLGPKSGRRVSLYESSADQVWQLTRDDSLSFSGLETDFAKELTASAADSKLPDSSVK